jgi:uncharacterized protein YegP (UPF0339 family)
MFGKYQVYKDISGNYRFRLRAENNKIVAVSQGYEQHASCMNGVKSVQNNCKAPIEDITIKGEALPNPKFQVFADKIGEFRFHLYASNGEIIAASEGYQTREGCLNGIEAVKTNCDAEIEDLTVVQMPIIVPKDAPMEIEEPIAPAVAKEIGIVDTKLELFNMPQKATKGDTVTFQGKLTNLSTGKGIPYAVIDLFERDRSFFNDEWLADAGTKEDGSFSIEWKVRRVDWWDDTAEIYARFYRHITAKASKSTIHKIALK